MLSESELIKSVIAGNRDDYAPLVRAHQRQVLSLCLSFLRSPAEAEDAAQEIFIKAYKNLARFRGDSSFSTWLYRIAYRHCIDIAREKAQRKECAIERDFAEAPRRQAQEEDRELIDKALAGLPEDYRAILIMREGGGLSYEEIAATLEISVDAVDAKIRRARVLFSTIARRFLTPATSKGMEAGNELQ